MQGSKLAGDDGTEYELDRVWPRTATGTGVGISTGDRGGARATGDRGRSSWGQGPGEVRSSELIWRTGTGAGPG